MSSGRASTRIVFSTATDVTDVTKTNMANVACCVLRVVVMGKRFRVEEPDCMLRVLAAGNTLRVARCVFLKIIEML